MIKSVLKKMNACNIISHLRRGYCIFPSGMFEKRLGEFLILKKISSTSRDKDTSEKSKRLIDYTLRHGKFPIDNMKGFEHINFDNEECLCKLDQQLNKTQAVETNYEETAAEKYEKVIGRNFKINQSAIKNQIETNEEFVDQEKLLEISHIIYYKGDDTMHDNNIKVVTFRPTWPPTNGSKSGHRYTGLNTDPGNNKKDKKDKQNHIQPVIVTTTSAKKADIPSISIDYRIMIEPYIEIYDDENEDVTLVALNKSKQSNLDYKVNEPTGISIERIKLEESNKFEVWKNVQDITNGHLKPKAIIRLDSPTEEHTKNYNMAIVQDTIKNEVKQRTTTTVSLDSFREESVKQAKPETVMRPDPSEEKTASQIMKTDNMKTDILEKQPKKQKSELKMSPDSIKRTIKEETEPQTKSNWKDFEKMAVPVSLHESSMPNLTTYGFKLEVPKVDTMDPLRSTFKREQQKTCETAIEEEKSKSNTNDTSILVRSEPISKKHSNLIKDNGKYTLTKEDVPKVKTDESRLVSQVRRPECSSENVPVFVAHPVESNLANSNQSKNGNASENEDTCKKETPTKTESSSENVPLAVAHPVQTNENLSKNETAGKQETFTKPESNVPIFVAHPVQPNYENPNELTNRNVSENGAAGNKETLTKPESNVRVFVAHPVQLNNDNSNQLANGNAFENEATFKIDTPTKSESSLENVPFLVTHPAQTADKPKTPTKPESDIPVFAANPVQPKYDNPNELTNGNVSENEDAGKKETPTKSDNQTAVEKEPFPNNKTLSEKIITASLPINESELIGDENEELHPYTFPTESRTIKLVDDQNEHVNTEVVISETKLEVIDDNNNNNNNENSTLNIADTSTIKIIDKKNNYEDIEQEYFIPEYKPDYRPESYAYEPPAPKRTCYINYTPQCCYYVRSPNTYQQSYQRYFLGLAEHYRHIQQPYLQPFSCPYLRPHLRAHQHEKATHHEITSETDNAKEFEASPGGELNNNPAQVLEAKSEQILHTETALGIDTKPINTESNTSQVEPMHIETQTNTYRGLPNPIVDTQSKASYVPPGKSLGRGSRSRAESVLKRRLPVETSAQRQLRNRRRTKHDNVSCSKLLSRNSLENEVPLSVLLEKAREKNRMEYCQLYESLTEQEKMYERLQQKHQTTEKKSSRDKSPPSCPPPSPTCPPPEPPRGSPPMSFPPMGRSPKFCPPKKNGFKFFDALSTLSVYDNDNANERSAKAGQRRELEKRLLGKEGHNRWIFVQGQVQHLYDAENFLECSEHTREDKKLLI